MMQIFSRLFQVLPDRLRGKQRIARWIIAAMGARERPISVKGRLDLNYQLPNLQENVSFEVFINGIYEPETSTYIAERLLSRIAKKKPCLLLDIGANIGCIALPLAAQLPDIKIHCIEASPHVYATLTDNVNRNKLDTQIQAHNVCLSNLPQSHVDFFSPVGLFGKGSLNASFEKNAVKVPNLSLDAFVELHAIRAVDFIKIDVEGYEKQVFESGAKLLASADAPDILFEVCSWAEKLAGNDFGGSQHTLLNLGYKLYDAEDGNRLLDSISNKKFVMLLASKRQLPA